MSRLLSKLSPLIHKRSLRSFSSSTTGTGPCVSVCSFVEPSSNKAEVVLFDAETFKLVRTPGKTFPTSLYDSQLVGASHGWGFFSNIQDRSVFISDFLNPYASKTEPKMIPLPPFTSLPNCQTQVMCNVAMSSSPEPYDQDWVVAIKFLGKQLSFCRPRRDMRWTNILTPFDSFDYSSLMYSKKDKRFYLPAPGSNYLCSWDLNFKGPKFHELVFYNPWMPSSRWKKLDSLCREDHWVESPSGESFLVKWFSEYTPGISEEAPYGFKSPSVVVYREEYTKDGKKYLARAEDIGDLAIFISRGEDFCIPGFYLPNTVCLNGRLFGPVSLTKHTFGPYEYPEDTPDRIPYSPYWLPPFSA